MSLSSAAPREALRFRPGAPQPDGGVERLIAERCRAVHAADLYWRTPDDALCLNLGYPPADAFAAPELAEAARQLRDTREDRAALQYCEERGDPALRQAIVYGLQAEKPRLSPDEILITHGTTTDTLPAIAQLLIDPADVVVMEAPTYLWAVRVFRLHGARIVPVETDREGMDPDALRQAVEQARREGSRVKLAYVMPDFHNPLGTTMPLSRRRALLDAAAELGVLLLEDDAYSHLRYRGVRLPTMFELDTAGVVMYARSFSKSFGPGLRLAWLAAPTPLIDRLALVRSGGACTFTSRLVASVLRAGHEDQVLERTRATYRPRWERMLDALQRELGGVAEWDVPDGGFFVWVRLPERIEEGAFVRRLDDAGILVLRGSMFYHETQAAPAVRLSFSFESPDRIEEGICRLGAALREATIHTR